MHKHIFNPTLKLVSLFLFTILSGCNNNVGTQVPNVHNTPTQDIQKIADDFVTKYIANQ